MEEAWQGLEDGMSAILNSPSTFTTRMGTTILLVTVTLLLRWFFSQLLQRRMEDVTRRYIVSKTVTYVIGLLLFLALLRVWLGGVTGIAAYLGILSAGLAIAMQDPLTNLAGWLFIMMRRPFVVGDRVQIGDHAGDVIDIRVFQFTLVEIGNWVQADQSTGRIIHIPNGWVLKQPLANYTQGFNFVWNELGVTITFESNWEKAKQILQDVSTRFSAVPNERAASEVRKAARQFMIFFEHLTPIVWTSVADHGVTLTIRYLCQPRNRRGSAEHIWEGILRAFAEADDIDFAYPTTRFYHNAAEGKPGARAHDKSETPPVSGS